MARTLTDICSDDFVIDTCVLAHSCQGSYPLHASSLALVEWIMGQSKAKWTLDDNGKKAPAVETSVLYAEYQATLPPQSLPLILLARYLQFGLVNFSSRPNQQIRNSVRDLIPRNKKDQVVLGATAGSVNKILVSNDEDDFPYDVRITAEAALGVTILSSDEVQP